VNVICVIDLMLSWIIAVPFTTTRRRADRNK